MKSSSVHGSIHSVSENKILQGSFDKKEMNIVTNHRVEAHIDLSALQHNLQIVKSLAPKQKIMAMVKANGYGHGLVRMAKALDQVDALGVACLDEALQLHDAGIRKSIILMEGVFSSKELAIAAQHQFAMVVHHAFQLDMLQHCQLKNPIKIWLKIDTGMHRLGFLLEQVADVYQQLQKCQYVQPDVGLMTHFASADDTSLPTTQQQIDRFLSISKNFAGPKSMANSAGIIAWPQSHADWVRPGIMLYGASPMQQDFNQINLKPVMTLQANIIAINSLRKGDAVGYGGTWVCPEDMQVGVVSIGYGDGYPRQLRNGTPVLVHNLRCPLVGRVSMDMITVDLRTCPTAQVGDVVTLWGKGLPAEEVALYADTISYTLFCGLTKRVVYSDVT